MNARGVGEALLVSLLLVGCGSGGTSGSGGSGGTSGSGGSGGTSGSGGSAGTSGSGGSAGTSGSGGSAGTSGSGGSGCTISARLVNRCRPWAGAAAHGNPGTPTEIQNGTAPKADSVSQLHYLEKLTGPNVSYDFYRSYNNCDASMNANNQPTFTCQHGTPLDPNGAEYYFATHGKYVDINWKPSPHWANAAGGSSPPAQAVNYEIIQVAKNFLKVQSNYPSARFLLTISHEPQDNVAAGTTSCPIRTGTAMGSPADYVAMWKNVEKIFKQQGVTNVLWAMDYLSEPQSTIECIVPQLWPGNKLVDWILFDTYGNRYHPTWADSVGAMYSSVTNLQGKTALDGSTLDVLSKPWGVGEYGNCGDIVQLNANPPVTLQDTIDRARQYYIDAKKAYDQQAYPKLKLYMIWADHISGNGGSECLTDYDVPDASNPNGIYDPIKQQNYNAFINDVLATP